MRTCLRIQPSEKVTLITDDASMEIAAASASELRKRGRAILGRFVLEDLAPRPLTDLPPQILDDLETSQVSHFRGAWRSRTNCGGGCR